MTSLNQDDFVGAGFKRLDPKLMPTHPPRIAWGQLYKQWDDAKKIAYLEKLASSMNFAADKIQQERDALNTACVKMEAKLAETLRAIVANNNMLQYEVTRMNEERQKTNKEIARLNAKLRAAGVVDAGGLRNERV